MLGVTLFGLFLTPVFYVMLRSRRRPKEEAPPPDLTEEVQPAEAT
jgi:HAE1 family hydrophobic/amphiphilic exporter-1